MNYRHLNIEERSALAVLRPRGLSFAEIGRTLLRHRTTLWRESKRNVSIHDGRYRASRAKTYPKLLSSRCRPRAVRRSAASTPS